MTADETPDVIEAALLRMWDDGNATGLDGWVGPDRGSEPDDYAIEVRRKHADRELDKLAHLLADPADRDADECPKCGCPTKCAEGRLEAAEAALVEANEWGDRYKARAERAEAEVAAYKDALNPAFEYVNQKQYTTVLGGVEGARHWVGLLIRDIGTAEAEVSRLNGALTARSAALNARIDSAEKITKDVMRERDDLRATLDRVRALADDWKDLRFHQPKTDFSRGVKAQIDECHQELVAALDGGEQP